MSMPKCTAGSTVGASSVCRGHSEQVRGLNSYEKVIVGQVIELRGCHLEGLCYWECQKGLESRGNIH